MSKTWIKDETSGGFKCEMPGNITLFATPVYSVFRAFKIKPARGTQWRAGCSHWDESTHTLSRFGRDAYMTPVATSAEACKLAMTIYTEALETGQ